MDKSVAKLGQSIKDVLLAINEAPAGVAFIVDEQEKLAGVFTDGDVRRLLLEGGSIDQLLTRDLLGENFVYGRQDETPEQLMQKTNYRIRIIPIVDENFRLVNYFRYEHKTHLTPVAEPALKGNEFAYLMDAYLSTWISSRGEYINRFEKSFSDYCGVEYGVCVSNGTAALHLALLSLDVGVGDEVIIPNLTFGATINAVLHTGATPVLVDINKTNWGVDLEEVKKAIGPKTKAIIPVHLYGHPCEMAELMEIAHRNRLYVIEDCAEAHGAEYDGKKVGSFGDISCFSFFANKIITTGEGGMCLTKNSDLDKKLRIIRDHGMSPDRKYFHEMVGHNFRMTNLQAAIGCAQLERIDSILEERTEIESKYRKILEGKGFEWVDIKDKRSKSVVWLVSCLTKNRENVMAAFRKEMIDVRPFFIPLSRIPIYEKYLFSEKNSLEIASHGINLPTVEGVDFSLVEKIAASL